LTSDELLMVTQRIIADLHVDPEALARNLSIYGPFAALERVLMALAVAGADRQEMHERLRQHALEAWEAIREGLRNPLLEQISQDAEIGRYLSFEQVAGLMDASGHLGDAPQRARRFVEVLNKNLGTPGE
jgi:adenylosuccinate lyase